MIKVFGLVAISAFGLIIYTSYRQNQILKRLIDFGDTSTSRLGRSFASWWTAHNGREEFRRAIKGEAVGLSMRHLQSLIMLCNDFSQQPELARERLVVEEIAQNLKQQVRILEFQTRYRSKRPLMKNARHHPAPRERRDQGAW